MFQQVLVLQDLGISRVEFDALVSKMNLPYQFITEKLEDISDTSSIVGVVTIKTGVDEEILRKLSNIQFIAVAFTGYDCVDMTAVKKRGVSVFNVPTYATDSTAELAAALALSLLREIPQGNQITKSGHWEQKPGVELAGKTVGIIGTGKIGVRAAQLFAAFKCPLIGWSKTEKDAFKNIGGVYKTTMEEVFRSVDIVSIHLPLNESTRGIVDYKILSKMKKSSYLINVARGPIVITSDLAQALEENLLAGAAVDVFDQEPILPDNPLLKSPHIILTPHIAYKTKEALLRRAEITLQNIRLFAEGTPQNLV